MKDFLFERNVSMLFATFERGQGLVEYAVIIAFVAIVVIVIVGLFGENVGNTFSSINNSLP